MKKFTRIILIGVAIIILVVIGGIVFIKTALPNVGAAPDLHAQSTPARVERGEYLAKHVAACMDCHSQRDWSIYAGPYKEGTFGAGGEKFGKEIGFPGELYSANITPYGIGKWTDGELYRCITTGQTKNGKALFPLMAYHNYGRSDPEDILSIIAYLRTLPSIASSQPERHLDFPLNILVNTFPSKAAMQKKPDSNNITAYGKYLVTMADCIECHSRVDKGSIIEGSEYGGGRTFRFPNGTISTSANITPDDETGIGKWDRSLFIRKFRQYSDSADQHRVLAPGDYNTPMPWLMYKDMKNSDLAAIFAYLKTLKPIKNKVQAFGH